MGNCKYCGKPAGFFRSKHAGCEVKQPQRERVIQSGQRKIAREVLKAIKGPESFDGLEKKIAEIERSSFIPATDRRTLLIKGWENAVEDFLEDGLLDTTIEKRLVEFQERFALSHSELDIKETFTKITKAAVLRDVLSGIVPQRLSFYENLPIHIHKSEQVVWAFSGSQYLEDKERRQYADGSQGISIRLMKGLYYRIGAFKGHPVEYTERVHIDTGWVVVTDKNIYFAGSRKSIRIPYAKIVSFEPFSYGIGIMGDAETAKAQIFVTSDGWFTYNLVTNLSRI